jgi:tRNA(Arg) A34 adenosine deaminase TadA
MNSVYMKEAIRLASENIENGGGPFGAVVVLDDKIIGQGGNRVTSTNDPTAHAEVVAIRDACTKLNTFSLKGATMYTSCEPCPMCLAAIYWARIEKVYYGNNRKDAAEIGFSDEYIYNQFEFSNEEKDLKLECLCRDEAQSSFKSWQDNLDKIPY